MDKASTGAQIINDSPDATHRWIVTTVKRFAGKAGIRMPEDAIYDGARHAFASGAFKNSALVAVATGLLQSMNLNPAVEIEKDSQVVDLICVFPQPPVTELELLRHARKSLETRMGVDLQLFSGLSNCRIWAEASTTPGRHRASQGPTR